MKWFFFHSLMPRAVEVWRWRWENGTVHLRDAGRCNPAAGSAGQLRGNICVCQVTNQQIGGGGKIILFSGWMEGVGASGWVLIHDPGQTRWVSLDLSLEKVTRRLMGVGAACTILKLCASSTKDIHPTPEKKKKPSFVQADRAGSVHQGQMTKRVRVSL